MRDRIAIPWRYELIELEDNDFKVIIRITRHTHIQPDPWSGMPENEKVDLLARVLRCFPLEQGQPLLQGNKQVTRVAGDWIYLVEGGLPLKMDAFRFLSCLSRGLDVPEVYPADRHHYPGISYQRVVE